MNSQAFAELLACEQIEVNALIAASRRFTHGPVLGDPLDAWATPVGRLPEAQGAAVPLRLFVSSSWATLRIDSGFSQYMATSDPLASRGFAELILNACCSALR